MKIIKRDKQRTVPFGALKVGDEFREDPLPGSRTMMRTEYFRLGSASMANSVVTRGSNRGCTYFIGDAAPVYPDPPREAEKVPYGSLPLNRDDGVTVFEYLGEVYARTTWRPDEALCLSDGREASFEPDDLVTPIDATLEY